MKNLRQFPIREIDRERGEGGRRGQIFVSEAVEMFTIYVFTISVFRSPVYKDINKSRSAMYPVRRPSSSHNEA